MVWVGAMFTWQPKALDGHAEPFDGPHQLDGIRILRKLRPRQVAVGHRRRRAQHRHQPTEIMTNKSKKSPVHLEHLLKKQMSATPAYTTTF